MTSSGPRVVTDGVLCEAKAAVQFCPIKVGRGSQGPATAFMACKCTCSGNWAAGGRQAECVAIW